jgi:hypothetical protein
MEDFKKNFLNRMLSFSFHLLGGEQANMYYQNLIERLNWIENRHTTLGESNIVKDIETGFHLCWTKLEW